MPETAATQSSQQPEAPVKGIFELPAGVRDAMVQHARDDFPNEACGLLAGTDGRVEGVYRMSNADASQMTYRLDPKEQIKVFNEMEDRGWDLRAIYHSHTHTPAYPSETDRRQAFYPEASYVLVSLQDRAHPDVRAYAIVDGVIEEQEVRIT